MQDRLGFLWVGSMEGLNRYDGKNFQIYKNRSYDENSIPNNYIQAIYEDSKGNIWVGTVNSGLAVYDCELNKFRRIKLPVANTNNAVTEIKEDYEGNIWVGTFGSGLFKINNFLVVNNYTKQNFDGCLSCDIVNSIFIDEKTNEMYIGGWTSGISILNLERNEFSYLKSEKGSENSLSDNRIKFIFEDSKKNLWITTHNGLSILDRSYGIIENHFHNPEDINSLIDNVLTGVCEDSQGNIWIGTRNSGLNSYDPDQKKFVRYSYDKHNEFCLPCNSILYLHTDNSNVLWIGTWGEGLCRCDRLQKKFHKLSNNNPDQNDGKSNQVTSLFQDSKNNFWIGTQNDGLYKAKLEHDSLISEKFGLLDKKLITGIFEDNAKNVWVSSQMKGLCSYNLITNEFQVYRDSTYNFEEDRIFALLKDPFRENLLWIGAENFGLIAFDINAKIFLNDYILPKELKQVTVSCLYMDGNGYLWIGTRGNGLLKYDCNNRIILENFELDNDLIWCINEDLNNTLFIGTSNNGLYRIENGSMDISNFNETDGLSNNNVYGIMFDQSDNIWLSTNNGLSRFNYNNKSFKNYVHKDGLQSDDFNLFSCFKLNSKTFFFGGMNGITYFDPEEIKDNPNIPKIVLTDFEIFNEPVQCSPNNPFLKKNISIAEEIKLTYRESVFSFKFAALIFNNPQKNQYAYMMEGFDKDWTYCGTRKRVTYTNLNPGDYVFRVKGSNNDGVWNEEGTSVKIHISPPYWKTLWFKGLGVLSALSAMGLVYSQRIEKLEKESKAQEEFSRKLIDLQEDERKRIASALHDTIAQDVTISKNKALMALKHKDDPKRMENTLKEISEMATETINEVRNISYNLRPPQLDRIGITKTIKSLVREIVKSTNIRFDFISDDIDDLLSKESEINLFRVIQETINNIMNHSNAIEAVIKITRLEDHLLIAVIDNGIGFNIEGKNYKDSKHGFGLSGIAERIKLVKGEFKIESEINKGTTLRFKIPLKNNYE